MASLIMLVGPPGSGKSTFAKNLTEKDGDNGASTVYINQDSQGKLEHMSNFIDAIYEGKDVIVDRMNFNRVQRLGYIEKAKLRNYTITIHVLHVPYAVCFKRACARTNHETIKDMETAEKAIKFFFKSYERVEDWEADKVVRHYMEGEKPFAICSDLDGTLCDVDHRRHYVRTEGKKKNWAAFNAGIKDDSLNKWCKDILSAMSKSNSIILCTGRQDSEWQVTMDWLKKHEIQFDNLFMRMSGDSRKDSIIKEIILDFEILPRYTPIFFLDDRNQVVEMFRRRGFTVLQVAEGDF